LQPKLSADPGKLWWGQRATRVRLDRSSQKNHILGKSSDCLTVTVEDGAMHETNC
jgi:hypothetical protein